MRGTKFRAWDIEAKEMRYIITDLHYALHGLVSCIWMDSGTCDQFGLLNDADCVGGKDRFILEQFTGEIDRKRTPEFPKGQEIWEGDNVKACIYQDEEEQILPVYYEDGAFWIDYKDSESDRVPIGCFIGSLEVVGNIHAEEKSCP